MKKSRFKSSPCNLIETLESRQLLSATSIGIFASIPSASETDPTTSGRGEFIVKRPTGSTADSLVVHFYARSTSTAVAGVDYEALSGTVTIPAGKRSAAINVIPIDNDTIDGDRTVVAILSPTDLTVTHRTATVTIHDNDTNTSNWLDNARHFRQALSINVGSTARAADDAVDNSINFTSVLSGLGKSGSFISTSIHVIETNAAGTAVLDSNVPYQFDEDSDFNASTKASGDLVILLTGSTAASTTRHYQVYFDTSGTFKAPKFTKLLTTTDNVADDGATDGAVVIQNETATFTYQKAEGGFSHIVDNNGNDWITWNSTPEATGEFRGAPNLGSLGFHPGRDHDVTTDIVSSGPLKTTIVSTDSDGNKVMWEFYPTYARLTVLNATSNYFALYEGTPGGETDFDNNDPQIVTSDDTVTPITQNFDEPNGLGSSNGKEWLYFNDPDDGTNGTSLFYVHDNADSVEDSYFHYSTGPNPQDEMTVFGFGRTLPDINDTSTGGGQLLSGQNTFTIGMTDGGGDFNSTSNTIEGSYQPITTTNGSAAIKS